MRPLIYVACPYRHKHSPAIEAFRLSMTYRVSLDLIDAGYDIYNPLGESVGMLEHGAANDWLTWREYDLGWINRADKLCLMCLDGWADSEGVQAELAYAKTKHKPIVKAVWNQRSHKFIYTED